MKTISINRCLSLPNLGNESDIDYLSMRLHKEGIAIEEKLVIANKCTRLCEKFHSYFHFEQSYFHLLLAKQTSDVDKKIEQLEEALFQDPLNHEAKHLLVEITGGSETQEYNEYTRDFESFADFLKFSSIESPCDIPPNSYWYYFDKYKNTVSIEYLSKTVDVISSAHKEYHRQAARIYHNRSVVFSRLGNEILSKNDIVKAMNLDPKII